MLGELYVSAKAELRPLTAGQQLREEEGKAARRALRV